MSCVRHLHYKIVRKYKIIYSWLMQTEFRSSQRIQLSIDIVLYRTLTALKVEISMFNCSNNS